MPEWAKLGPISLRNYAWRVWRHCTDQSSKRGGSHPVIGLETPEFPLWLQYFYRHLGGVPLCARMVIERKSETFTAPEQVPQWFDPSFEPDLNWRVPEYQTETRAGFRATERANLFIRSDNPIYAEMVERARHADTAYWRGDHERGGIWIPFNWMPDRGEGGRRSFKPLSAGELRMLYRHADEPAKGDAA